MKHFWIWKKYRRDISGFIQSSDGTFLVNSDFLLTPRYISRNLNCSVLVIMGHVVSQLVEVLRYKPKAAGSIPVGATGIFHWHNPSVLTVALGSTQPLTEIRKCGRCIWQTTLSFSCAEFVEIWEPQPAGYPWTRNRPAQGLLYLYMVVYKVTPIFCMSKCVANCSSVCTAEVD